MPGFRFEYAVVRWYGNIGGPFGTRAEAMEYFGSVSGASLYRRLTWGPRAGTWRKVAHKEWPGHGDPQWWEKPELLKWGWLSLAAKPAYGG